MNFERFVNSLSKIKDFPLPGIKAQLEMAPLIRQQELREYGERRRNARRAAVLSLFYPDQRDQTNFMLIHRKTYPGVHSNQVGFPGGKFEEEDKGLEQTALRETEEEIGVSKNSITIIKELTDLYIPPSNFVVQPYLGLIEHTPSFVPQDDEVEGLIEVKLSHFLEDRSLTSQKLSTSYAKEIEVPAFELNGYIVWGATAMMLNEVKAILRATI
ncbi:NUDIX hydrolase [Sungkyunkwania multivorans]|uniref:NUDIX hydrolase n=1 Tax=Sungkyunkwania multivorans TaxID=1173618 RepID=A0ABW3CSV3_9FLAO